MAYIPELTRIVLYVARNPLCTTVLSDENLIRSRLDDDIIGDGTAFPQNLQSIIYEKKTVTVVFV